MKFKNDLSWNESTTDTLVEIFPKDMSHSVLGGCDEDTHMTCATSRVNR